MREPPNNWTDIRRGWPVLRLYQRLETVVAFLLTFVISIVIVIALYRLIVQVVDVLVLQALNPLDHAVFQAVFGEIMTLLIALEFNHTLRYAVAGELGIIQTRVVILIAQLALARKVIVVDLQGISPAAIASLAALAIALGVAYWLIGAGSERAPHTEQPGMP